MKNIYKITDEMINNEFGSIENFCLTIKQHGECRILLDEKDKRDEMKYKFARLHKWLEVTWFLKDNEPVKIVNIAVYPYEAVIIDLQNIYNNKESTVIVDLLKYPDVLRYIYRYKNYIR